MGQFSFFDKLLIKIGRLTMENLFSEGFIQFGRKLFKEHY